MSVAILLFYLIYLNNNIYIYIYSNQPAYNALNFKTWSERKFNVSFSQMSDALYNDYGGDVYKVDNLQEMSQSNLTIKPHIIKLENMRPCRMATFDNNAIYCSVKAEEIGKIIEDQDNINIIGNQYPGKKYFIIKQNINQKSPQDYQVLNLAPLMDAYHLTILSDTHIAAGDEIINMKTKRIVKDPPSFGLGGSADMRAIRYYGDQ